MVHIRIDITDDHPMVISGIKNMLYYYKHIEIGNVYHSGKALLEGLEKEQPDLLLLDIQLPDKSGNELARIITKKYPEIRILILTSMDNLFHLKDMMRSGCSGYLLKTADKETLVTAIEEVAAGGEFIQQSLKDQLVHSVLKTKAQKDMISPLTRREKEILALIASEMTNPEIAKKLHLSQRTVENHRFSLMQKLNVKNTAGLTKLALEMGVI